MIFIVLLGGEGVYCILEKELFPSYLSCATIGPYFVSLSGKIGISV